MYIIKKTKEYRQREIQGLKIQGGYLFFVDSDDTINFDTISECVRLIEEENADLVMGGYSGIGEKGYLRWSIIPQGVKCYTGIELLEKKKTTSL